MSFQGSSLTPPTMDDLIDINMLLDGDDPAGYDEETLDGGNIEIGEMIDMELPVPTDTPTTTQNTATTQNTPTIASADEPTPPVAPGPSQSSQSQANAFGKAPRPKKSAVHNEMDVIETPEGAMKWKCRWCGKLYTYDSKYKSTSNAKKHLGNCIQRKLRVRGNIDKEVVQSRLNVCDANTPNIATWTYNHGRVREVAAHMVLGHEYPFSVMDHVIFNEFLKTIYPWYKKITRQQVKVDCEVFYEAERVNMKKSMSLINRISLTTDL